MTKLVALNGDALQFATDFYFSSGKDPFARSVGLRHSCCTQDD